MEKSKSKSKNLKESEKEKIINIIVKYKNVIENKKTDAITLAEKNKIWEKVAEEFNSCSALKRTTQQLKNFYKNSKSDLKKQVACNRAEIFKTGGGSPATILNENNPLLSVVLDQTFSIRNEFDSSRSLFSYGDDSGDYSVERDSLECEMLEKSTEENQYIDASEPNGTDNEKQRSNVKGGGKKKRTKNSINHEKTIKFVEEIAELKKRKLETEIQKNQAKTEVYRKKLDILNKMDV